MDGRKFKRQRHQLGPTQRAFLRMVYKHGGSWSWGCGYHWLNKSHDTRIAQSLFKRGLLGARESTFEITDAGKRQAEQIQDGDCL